MFATVHGQAWTLITLFDIVPRALQASAFAQYILMTVAALIPTLLVLMPVGWFTRKAGPIRLGLGITGMSLIAFAVFRLVTDLPLVEAAPIRQLVESLLQLALAPAFVWVGRTAREWFRRATT